MPEDGTSMLRQLSLWPAPIASYSPEPHAIWWGEKTRPSTVGMVVSPATAKACPVDLLLRFSLGYLMFRQILSVSQELFWADSDPENAVWMHSAQRDA
jgi:hypothetical protein